jgi:crotonobetainyl-CoA:carnitine CoA-transferase CaiB-like acyl-CoA transferase
VGKEILEGIRVLDCSIAMAGPFAAQRLGDIGADVIKIEPVTGEWQRHVSAGGADGNRINTSFLSLNRNKRSLAVDLKSSEGKELVYELVKTSDIFLQNYRSGVAARLGLDYETLVKINPKLIYVSITGYGEEGPYKERPGQDLLLQAMSGAMLSAGRSGERPNPGGQYLVDAVTAYTAFEGVLAALFHRERTGEGQLVEVNMLDVIVTLQMQELSVFTVGKKPQTRSAEPHAHVYIKAPYGVFKTKDDKYIAIAFSPLDVLSDILNVSELKEHDADNFEPENRDSIFRLIDESIAKFDSDEIMTKFNNAGIWAGPVNSYEDVVNDPQIKVNKTFVEYEHPTEGKVKTPGFPIRFNKTPSKVNRGAPLTGEHTREILEHMGLEPELINDLINRDVIAETLLDSD